MRKHFAELQPILAPLVFFAAATTPALGHADGYTISVSQLMDLDKVISAPSGETVFRLDPQSGQVSKITGNGRRLSNSTVRVLVTIRCSTGNGWVDSDDHDSGGGNDKIRCGKDRPWVRIGPIGVTTGRALPLQNFTVAMSSASLASGVSGSAPIRFQLNPIGDNQSRTFYVGAEFPVAGDDSRRPSGYGLAPYYISVSEDSDGDGAYATKLTSAVLSANRAISITKVSDLRFGIVSRATTSGTITIDPNTGERTVTGGGYGYPTPAWGPAVFDITGEGGQSFSISVPQTIQLAGPTNLNVQTTKNLGNTATLPGSAGSSQTVQLKVGGYYPIANGSLIGTYSGNWTVTIDYN